MNKAKMLERTRPETCLSDLVLDRLIAGELEGLALEQDAKSHLGSCLLCRARLEALKKDGALFPQEIAAPLPKRSYARWISAVGALAATFVAIAIAKTVSDEPGIRTKGGIGLGLVVRHLDGRTEAVLPGAKLHPNEAIRFEVSVRAPGHLFITGIDSARNVTSYYDAALTKPLTGELLEGSVTLDATLGPERIFALLCDKPIDARVVLQKGRDLLERAGGDPLAIEGMDSGCLEGSFVIEKVR